MMVSATQAGELDLTGDIEQSKPDVGRTYTWEWSIASRSARISPRALFS
jgi:hypothetical protein